MQKSQPISVQMGIKSGKLVLRRVIEDIEKLAEMRITMRVVDESMLEIVGLLH
jgi:hypothetical protein